MSPGSRDLDVVVFGATGYVGRLVAAYLAQHAPSDVRVGLAGRSEERLGRVRDHLGAAAEHWPLLVADAHDAASMVEASGIAKPPSSGAG